MISLTTRSRAQQLLDQKPLSVLMVLSSITNELNDLIFTGVYIYAALQAQEVGLLLYDEKCSRPSSLQDIRLSSNVIFLSLSVCIIFVPQSPSHGVRGLLNQ